jgi:hypothetical protein
MEMAMFPPDPVFARDWTTEGRPRQMAFTTRMLGLAVAVLLFGIADLQAAPLDRLHRAKSR